MYTTHNEEQFLFNHLNKELKVLEYGAGQSTIDISSRCKSIISIEHDELWYKSQKDIPENVLIILKKPNKEYVEGGHCGTYDQFEDYINAPKSFGKFDVIFIDGRARIECVKFIHQVCKDDTIIFIHDFTSRIKTEGYGDILEYLDLIESVEDMSMFKIKKPN